MNLKIVTKHGSLKIGSITGFPYFELFRELRKTWNISNETLIPNNIELECYMDRIFHDINIDLKNRKNNVDFELEKEYETQKRKYIEWNGEKFCLFTYIPSEKVIARNILIWNIFRLCLENNDKVYIDVFESYDVELYSIIIELRNKNMGRKISYKYLNEYIHCKYKLEEFNILFDQGLAENCGDEYFIFTERSFRL